jgi:hypothetical protein
MKGIDRKTYALFVFVPKILLGIFIIIIRDSGFYSFCNALGFFILFVIIYLASIERLKNLNQKTLFVLLIFIPLVNLGLLFYLLFAPPFQPILDLSRSDVKLEKVEHYCPDCGAPRQSWYKICPTCGNEFNQA